MFEKLEERNRSGEVEVGKVIRFGGGGWESCGPSAKKKEGSKHKL